MQFDARLLVPTLKGCVDMVAAMPASVLVAWLAIAVAGAASDVATDRVGDVATLVLIVYGVLLAFVQVWITREAFEQMGIRPTLSVANSMSLYLQAILIGLGTLLGMIALILPGLYVFARWYLAGAVLVRDGGGRRDAMQRSWDMLVAHWPAALGIGLIFFLLSAAPLVAEGAAPVLAAEYGFGWLVAANLVSGAGIVGGYLAAVCLLTNIERPEPALHEIFG